MNQRNASMTVIGAGSYGTALAITLARNGHEVVLWGHDPEHIATLERDRCNAAFLPDVPFPDTLHLESDLATALAASRNILVVVPSHVFGEVLRQIKPLMRPDARLVWATKGLEAETGRLLQDVAREALGDQIPLAVISGPTFAKELAAGLPTAISLASTDQTFADDLQQLLHCGKSFRVYSNPDFIGVQLGGAVKNVGMGCGSRAGKMDMHSSGKPSVDKALCRSCGACMKNCAHGAIAFDEAHKAGIDHAKCVGCGRCIGACNFDAVYAANDAANDELNCKMAEYAKAVVDGRPAFYINIVNQVSPYCDCHSENDAAIIPDVGMFASFDPIALDVACADACNAMPVIPGTLLDENLTRKGACNHHDHFTNTSPETNWKSCMEHGEKIGLGTQAYELIIMR